MKTNRDSRQDFKAYDRFLNRCVKAVQKEMGQGKVGNEERLVDVIEKVSRFTDPVKAFAFFSKISPYRWQDCVSEEELVRFDCDLEALVLHVTHSMLSFDIFRILQETEGYAFLIGQSKPKPVRLPDKTLVVLTPRWKSEADQYRNLPPLKTVRVKDKKLKRYSGPDFKPVYLLSHKDPTLVWLSRSIVSEPNQMVKAFDELREKTLTALGVHRETIDGTEILMIDQFPTLFRDTFNLHDFQYVLYYHHQRQIKIAVGFNGEPELEDACRTLAARLQNDRSE